MELYLSYPPKSQRDYSLEIGSVIGLLFFPCLKGGNGGEMGEKGVEKLIFS